MPTTDLNWIATNGHKTMLYKIQHQHSIVWASLRLAQYDNMLIILLLLVAITGSSE